ncbi:hypothetical protein H7827_04130 [Streptomyces sp. JH002]|uniref:hypothetical protein n=1 Tax=Streptomyces sp. JH002 TaxID=2763259 RepID=UPI003D802C04
MRHGGSSPSGTSPSTPRRIADAYVDQPVELNPLIGALFGVSPGADGLPDCSPDGHAALERATLATWTSGARPGCCANISAPRSPWRRRGRICGINNVFCPVHQQRAVFQLNAHRHRRGRGGGRPPTP